MKRLISIFLTLMLIVGTTSITVFADDDAPVCQVTEGWSVLEKETWNEIDKTVTLNNNVGWSNYMKAEAYRTAYTEVSGGVELTLIESLLGVKAELGSGETKSILVNANTLVPAYTTVYVDIGSSYVRGVVQRYRINSDCSKTYLGNKYSATYTYGPYVEIRDQSQSSFMVNKEIKLRSIIILLLGGILLCLSIILIIICNKENYPRYTIYPTTDVNIYYIVDNYADKIYRKDPSGIRETKIDIEDVEVK